MNDHSTYFYGIDFKKIQVYCKVKQPYKPVTKYLKQNNIRLKINTSYYPVENIYLFDEELEITVDCIRFQKVVSNRDNIKRVEKVLIEDRQLIKLSFDDVEFAYFFEDTKEDDLDKNFF